MKLPSTLCSLCALQFGLIGAMLILFGAIFSLAGIPFKGGPSWFFLPIGAVLLLLSLGCRLLSCLQRRRIARLKAAGLQVMGEIQSVQHVIWINWKNTETFVNWPGQYSPWVVRCSYCYQGKTYTVKSDLSWLKPSSGAQRPIVYFDSRRPAHAYVDMDTIRWEL